MSMFRTRSLVSLATGLAMTGALALPALAQAQKAAPLSKPEVEQIVRDYILKNPEIIMEAIAELQKREEQATAARVANTLKAAEKELYESPGSPIVGNPKGDVTMVEFFDYQCGFCKRAHPQRVAAVEADGKVRVVMKEFPILGPASVEAAKAALASVKQGKYEAYHSALMTNTAPLNTDRIFEIAKKTGLDVDKLKKDMESPDIRAEIEANVRLATSLNITGTPGFVVGQTIVPGAIGREAFTQMFEQRRAELKGK